MALGFSELGGRTPSPTAFVIIPDYRPSDDRREPTLHLPFPFSVSLRVCLFPKITLLQGPIQETEVESIFSLWVGARAYEYSRHLATIGLTAKRPSFSSRSTGHHSCPVQLRAGPPSPTGSTSGRSLRPVLASPVPTSQIWLLST